MATANFARRATGAILSVTLCTVLALAQADPASSPGPLRTAPAEKLAVNPEFRDWGPTAEANWPFGFVTPVEGGLWVDSYQALVKLQ